MLRVKVKSVTCQFKKLVRKIKKLVCLIERLLGSFDNLILQRLAQITEMIAVSGHAHDQVFVVFRVFLGLDQGFFIYDVELNVVSVHVEVGTHQIRHLIQPFLACDYAWGELLVQQRSACLEMIHLGTGFYDCRRPVGICAFFRGDSLGYRLVGQTSVGACHHYIAEIYMAADDGI